eukprot:TRINITY_DN1016_c1_g1_i2.p1 TRINITY_DN1016_c1_g1~~TRINITY_DN1016_c1_g1_i2.p1  ORF type:complete len:1052 (+),score=239.37 TRINITY_DN1016_c1_g1_i2:468-3623(+)
MSLNSCLFEINQFVSPQSESFPSVQDFLLNKFQIDSVDYLGTAICLRCIELLFQLENALHKTPYREVTNSEGTVDVLDKLSSADKVLVTTLIEILIGCAIAPCIESTLSFSLKDKGELWGKIISKTPNSRMLVRAVSALLSIHKEDDLLLLIIPRYQIEIITGLLHLAYSPTIPASNQVNDLQPIYSNTASLDQIENVDSIRLEVRDVISVNDRNWAITRLKHLETLGLPSDLINCFMYILKTSKQSWIKSHCGNSLTRVLISPNGLQATLIPLLSQADVSDQHYNQVARLICTVPKQVKSDSIYYKLICPQIIQVLHKSKGESAPHFIQTAATIVNMMLDSKPELTHRYFIQLLFKPFRYFVNNFEEPTDEKNINNTNIDNDTKTNTTNTNTKTNTNTNTNTKTNTNTNTNNNNGDEYLEDENSISNTVVSITNLLSFATTTLIESILKYFKGLWKLYCFSCRSKSFIKSMCESIIIQIFQMSMADTITKLMEDVLFNKKDEVDDDYLFKLGTSGGVVLVKNTTTAINTIDAIDGGHDDSNGNELLDLLNNDRHTSDGRMNDVEVFVNLTSNPRLELKFTKEYISDIILDTMQRILDASNDHINQSSSSSGGNVQSLSSSIQFLILMLSKYGGSIIIANDDVVRFNIMIKNLIESDDEEVVHIAMSILLTVLKEGQMKLKKEEEILVFDMLNRIEQLKLSTSSGSSEMIIEIATELHTTITSRDACWRVKEDEENQVNNTKSSKDEEEVMKKIYSELKDPLLPVRAHALISLRKFILSKNKYVTDHLEDIVNTLQQQLQDDDSYVYLGAIQALNAIGDIAIHQVLPRIREVFLNIDTNATQQQKPIQQQQKQQQQRKGGYSNDIRMKIGEVLQKITQRLGELVPHHAQSLFSIYFAGIQDYSSPDIQASSLSNLSQLCELLLDYGIQPFLEEIIVVVTNVLNRSTTVWKERKLSEEMQNQTISEYIVHRAALVVIVYLLNSTGSTFAIIGSHHLQSLYDLLKRVRSTHPDEVCREHAHDAINCFDEMVGEILMPEYEAPKYVNSLKIVEL